MTSRGLRRWARLTCFGSTLALTTACQLPTDEDKDGDEPSHEGEPRPGDMQSPGGYNGSGAPAVRKLALDLTGVAGFAILEQNADGAASSPGSDLLSVSSGAASAPQALWLNSSSASGHVIVREAGMLLTRQASLDGAAALGSAPALQARGSERLAQQEREAPAGAAAPAEGGTSGDVAPEPTSEDAAEQTGLLKITEDGEVTPALVVLEEEPVVDASGEPKPDAGTAGTGDDPGVAPSEGTADAGAPAPTGSSGAGGGGAPPPDGTAMPRPGPTHYEPMPRVTAVGLSPDGNVYILFERRFMYRQPSAEEMANGFDPYAPDSGFSCQLFRARGDWRNAVAQANSEQSELECVTSQYDVRTWDARRVMQFDASGKLYFRASIPGQPNELFYQYNPETGELREKVNANICWRDVQVTPRGSLFYTGQSGGDGMCGGGSSFFRYVSADNRLTEIARDWYDFKYLAEQDPGDPDNERIIFYGPHPSATSGTNAWQSACLYRYDPAIEVAADRTQPLVECVGDPWNYVTGSCMGSGSPLTSEQVATCIDRCTSDGQLFIGGQGVSEISQLGDGTLFVVGTFQRKIAGSISCNLQVSVDHCAESADWVPGVAVYPELETEQACTDAGHVWLRKDGYCDGYDTTDPGICQGNAGTWYNGFGGIRSYDQATGDTCSVTREGFTTQWLNCNAQGGNQPGPGGGFMQEVNGLAYLVPRPDSTLSEITLLSDPTETVERYWPVAGPDGAELFYSVYSAGNYSLRVASQGEQGVERRSILDGFEVYNLQRDPANLDRVLFDALEFATNSYIFGSINTNLSTPEEVVASLELMSGVSGRVETLIILPSF